MDLEKLPFDWELPTASPPCWVTESIVFVVLAHFEAFLWNNLTDNVSFCVLQLVQEVCSSVLLSEILVFY